MVYVKVMLHPKYLPEPHHTWVALLLKHMQQHESIDMLLIMVICVKLSYFVDISKNVKFCVKFQLHVRYFFNSLQTLCAGCL